MEKASIFNGVGKYLMGPSLAALMSVASPAWADGMPEEGAAATSEDTDQNSAQLTTKEMNAQLNRIEDKLNRLIRQLETKAQPKKN